MSLVSAFVFRMISYRCPVKCQFIYYGYGYLIAAFHPLHGELDIPIATKRDSLIVGSIGTKSVDTTVKLCWSNHLVARLVGDLKMSSSCLVVGRSHILKCVAAEVLMMRPIRSLSVKSSLMIFDYFNLTLVCGIWLHFLNKPLCVLPLAMSIIRVAWEVCRLAIHKH